MGICSVLVVHCSVCHRIFQDDAGDIVTALVADDLLKAMLTYGWTWNAMQEWIHCPKCTEKRGPHNAIPGVK